MWKKSGIMCFALIFVIALFQPKSTYAGIYTDELTKCIIESTSTEELTGFVRWMFALMSIHPDVQDMATITEKKHDEANQQCAALFMRILTVSCKEQSKKAWNYEGKMSFQSSFKVLGEVAMRELLSNPKVNAGAEGFAKYLNEEKIKSALDIK